MTALARTLRILRVLPRAARVLRRDVGGGLATARHNTRAVWLVSDPEAISELFAQAADDAATAQDDELRRRQQQRMRERRAAFDRAGLAVYEGRAARAAGLARARAGRRGELP